MQLHPTNAEDAFGKTIQSALSHPSKCELVAELGLQPQVMFFKNIRKTLAQNL